MAAKDLGPLDWRTPIVDTSGRPSPEFQRRWNTQRGNNGLIGAVTTGSGAPTGTPSAGAEYVDTSTTPFTVYIGAGGTWHKAGAVVFTDLIDAPHAYAGNGLALVRVKSTVNGVEFVSQSTQLDTLGAPASGQLLQRGASTWGLVTLSSVLDGISSTRGSVLYRGAAGWVALAPGTAGFVLKTGGPGADPSWIAQSGGSGGSGNFKGYAPINVHTGTTFGVGNWAGISVIMDEACSLTRVLFWVTAAVPTATMVPAIYDATGTVFGPGTLLATGPLVTGATLGLNTLLLTAPLAVTANQPIWIGLVLQVASVNLGTTTGPNTAFWNTAGLPPATAPASNYSVYGGFSMWGSK